MVHPQSSVIINIKEDVPSELETTGFYGGSPDREVRLEKSESPLSPGFLKFTHVASAGQPFTVEIVIYESESNTVDVGVKNKEIKHLAVWYWFGDINHNQPILIEVWEKDGTYTYYNKGDDNGWSIYNLRSNPLKGEALERKLEHLNCEYYKVVTMDLTLGKHQHGNSYCCSKHNGQEKVYVQELKVPVGSPPIPYYKHEIIDKGYKLTKIKYYDYSVNRKPHALSFPIPGSISACAFYCGGKNPVLLYLHSEDKNTISGWFKKNTIGTGDNWERTLTGVPCPDDIKGCDDGYFDALVMELMSAGCPYSRCTDNKSLHGAYGDSTSFVPSGLQGNAQPPQYLPKEYPQPAVSYYRPDATSPITGNSLKGPGSGVSMPNEEGTFKQTAIDGSEVLVARTADGQVYAIATPASGSAPEGVSKESSESKGSTSEVPAYPISHVKESETHKEDLVSDTESIVEKTKSQVAFQEQEATRADEDTDSTASETAARPADTLAEGEIGEIPGRGLLETFGALIKLGLTGLDTAATLGTSGLSATLGLDEKDVKQLVFGVLDLIDPGPHGPLGEKGSKGEPGQGDIRGGGGQGRNGPNLPNSNVPGETYETKEETGGPQAQLSESPDPGGKTQAVTGFLETATGLGYIISGVFGGSGAVGLAGYKLYQRFKGDPWVRQI
ncbi:hypothetical protein BEWA_047360 [Theileria equi strain WA]|uniref:Uncharacterized protein n=1 Tax=Theileria equi strain WA TaxID=1537102 RepID=L1LAE6_THEEQ|nr:hypothetical protein BEWA_047360 [Theileria equi strain WA]EKX72271.1 hypothetical protein BEWA_047360 [Theileria equi strain WA]|eukprot:XP_004831723.1 hypothetical protein BEWA_047360 [Theileria equi strain WA]